MEREFRRGWEVLDPMAGYGTVTRYCLELGMSSYCLEYNRPQYLWQTLSHPAYTQYYLEMISVVRDNMGSLPVAHIRATASDDWFEGQSIQLLRELLACFETMSSQISCEFSNHTDLALAFLMPFAGRFGCYVDGDVATNVKKGGICVFRGWEHDLAEYLDILEWHLKNIVDLQASPDSTVKINVGDARTFRFPERAFRAMYTSPPYPNHQDFADIFGPENALLNLLNCNGHLSYEQEIIGANFVNKGDVGAPESAVANRFLSKIKGLSGLSKRQQSDERVWYLPYLSKYFFDLELAYRNIERALASNFVGYIVVVNNTHRGQVIPVSDVVKDIWHELGYSSRVYHSNERSHVGAKNPRSKGIRAKHIEYVIKIWN